MNNTVKTKKVSKSKIFSTGILAENPIFVQMLGMCPSLAITTSVEAAIGMGILVIFVLTMSNIVISLIKNFVPQEAKIPSFIVVIATFVTIVSMMTEAFAPDLFSTLGVFISLIVVNCLVLGRAEAFASHNTVLDSTLDGLGMGLGYTLGLVVISFFRELLSKGSIVFGNVLPLANVYTIFDLKWFGIDTSKYVISLFANPGGAFITLGCILSIMSLYRNHKQKKLDAAKKARIAELKKAKAKRDAEAKKTTPQVEKTTVSKNTKKEDNK